MRLFSIPDIVMYYHKFSSLKKSTFFFFLISKFLYFGSFAGLDWILCFCFHKDEIKVLAELFSLLDCKKISGCCLNSFPFGLRSLFTNCQMEIGFCS